MLKYISVRVQLGWNSESKMTLAHPYPTGLYYSSIKYRKMQYSHGYLGDVTPSKNPAVIGGI